MTQNTQQEFEVSSEVPQSAGEKRASGVSIINVVRTILDDAGPGKLAQVGPSVYMDTNSEQGFVDCTTDIERKAAAMIGRCAKKSGCMSALESFITVPQATAYRATPYFYWHALDRDKYTADDCFVNDHWEPYLLSSDAVVFADGIYYFEGNQFKDWSEVGVKLFGPRIMMTFDEVSKAKPTEQFNEFLHTLHSVMPDDDARLYFQKLVGHTIQPHVTLKKGVFIHGPSGARKSTTATAILCAPAGVGGFSMESLDKLADNRDAGFNLINKFANLSDDPEGKTPKWVSWFKRYTGSSLTSLETKYVRAKNYPNTAKLITCCNSIPKMGDSSDAVWSRLCVFKFERAGELEEAFAKDRADNNKLHAEYWCDPKTRAMMLKWLMTGLKKAREDGMEAPKLVKRWNSEAAGAADAVRYVLEERFEKAASDVFLPYSELAAELESAGHGVSAVVLSEYLTTLFGAVKGKGSIKGPTGIQEQVRGYYGVKRSN